MAHSASLGEQIAFSILRVCRDVMSPGAVQALVARNLAPDAAQLLERSAAIDYSTVGEPRLMTRQEVAVQILLPAAQQGWLKERDPVKVLKAIDSMADEPLREWASSVLFEHPWPPGFHMPSFAEFVTSPRYLGEHPPTPRQAAVFTNSIGGTFEEWFIKPRGISLLVMEWGKGCLAAGERLTDAGTGETRTVAEWEAIGCPLTVKSWDGRRTVAARATPVYRKGIAPLFRVALHDGRSFEATATHRCLTETGWAAVSDFIPGVTRLQSLPRCASPRIPSSPFCKKGRVASGLRVAGGVRGVRRVRAVRRGWLRGCGVPAHSGMASPPCVGFHVTPPKSVRNERHTGAGSPVGCRPLFHFDDGPLLPREEGGQVLAPLPAGVPARTRRCSPEDGRELGPEYTRPCHGCGCGCSRKGPEASPIPPAARARVSSRAGALQPLASSARAGLFPGRCPGTRRVLWWSRLLRSDGLNLQGAQGKDCGGASSCGEVSQESFPYYSRVVSVSPTKTAAFYDLTVEGTNCYYGENEVLHHNSGKDLVAAEVITYSGFGIGSMRNPWHHFRMPMGEIIDCINVAETERHARRVFFRRLYRMLTRNCFKGILDPNPRTGDIHTDEVNFKKKVPGYAQPLQSLRLLSLHSRNEGAEGANTLLFVMDEADAFRTAEGHANADAMLDTLTTSNRFADQQLGIVISYPRAQTGFMKKIIRMCGNRSETGNPEWWGDTAPTWEVLPWKVFIPKIVDGVRRWTNPAGHVGDRPDTQMARMYRTNREKFEAMYKCNPPVSLDAFFSLPEKIDEAVTAAAAAFLRPAARVLPYITRRQNAETGRIIQRVARRLENLRLRQNVPYFLGGDAGETQDSYALALGHAVPPNEKGQICPACFRDRARRTEKHYRVEAIPTREEEPYWPAPEYRCDWCQAVPKQPAPGTDPRAVPPFWGFARPSGQVVETPILLGYDANGGERWDLEEVLVRDEVTGVERMEQRPRVERRYLPMVVCDLLIEWKPDRSLGLPVDFRNVADTILSLNRFGRLAGAKIDRWNATMLIQELQNAGINAETKNFSNPEQLAMYGNGKSLFYENLVFMPEDPENPAFERCLQQLKEVQLINGNKIDHPDESVTGERGAKDLPDALMIMLQLAVDYQSGAALVDTGLSGPAERAMLEQGQAQVTPLDRRGVVAQTLRELGIMR